jgi:hypothetical protein
VIVAAAIASLNVAVMDALRGVPVAALAGAVDMTVGAVVSEPGLVLVSLLQAVTSPATAARIKRKRFI